MAQRHHLSVLGAARALVDLTSGPIRDRWAPEPGRFDEWDTLLAQLPSRRHAG